MLVYNRPVEADGELVLHPADRPPAQRAQPRPASVGQDAILASIVILLAAFGIGWLLSGITLRPIQRLTQTAQAIGEERDFARRVDYRGRTRGGAAGRTFNAMLEQLQRLTSAWKARSRCNATL